MLDPFAEVSPFPLDSLSKSSSFLLNTGKKSAFGGAVRFWVIPLLDPSPEISNSDTSPVPVSLVDSDWLEGLRLVSGSLTAEAKSAGGGSGGSIGMVLVGRVCSL